MIVSTDATKAFDKIQYSFMVKKKNNLCKQEIERNILNLIKTIYKNVQLTLYLIVRNQKTSGKIRKKANVFSLTTPFQHCI